MTAWHPILDDEFAGFGEEEASRPVDGGEGGEDNLDGGPTVTDSEWGHRH